MEHQEDTPVPHEKSGNALFVSDWPQYNKPARIVTLGHYYPKNQIGTANNLVRESRGSYSVDAAASPKTVRQNLGWTKLINALAEERQWPIKRLVAMLSPMLES